MHQVSVPIFVGFTIQMNIEFRLKALMLFLATQPHNGEYLKFSSSSMPYKQVEVWVSIPTGDVILAFVTGNFRRCTICPDTNNSYKALFLESIRN